MISIIMPVYNEASWLAKAIDSCLEQSEPDFELIIVNDGSTDSSPLLIEWFAEKDTRIKPFTILHSGAPRALNYGVEQAKGEIICFAAGDDIQEKNKVQVIKETFAAHKVDFLYTSYYHATIAGEIYEEVRPHLLSPETIKTNTTASGGAIACRKSVFDTVKFRENIPFNEDMAFLWDLYTAKMKPLFLDIPTFRYRLTPKSVSYKHKKTVEKITHSIGKEIDAWLKKN